MKDVSPKRSALMARVRTKHTKPEMAVRQAAHALGYRFRLHCRNMPGSPDLVFPSRKMAIFVHGCFWHRHVGCRRTTTPKTRAAFWQTKFDANVVRDARNIDALQSVGWKVLIVWECETIDPVALRAKLPMFLDELTRAGKAPFATRRESRRARYTGSEHAEALVHVST
jgi:DNA mismatch endonuclease, patch repair protein